MQRGCGERCAKLRAWVDVGGICGLAGRLVRVVIELMPAPGGTKEWLRAATPWWHGGFFVSVLRSPEGTDLAEPRSVARGRCHLPQGGLPRPPASPLDYSPWMKSREFLKANATKASILPVTVDPHGPEIERLLGL